MSQWILRKVVLLCPACDGWTKKSQGFTQWVWIAFVMLNLNILKMPFLPPSVLPCPHNIGSFFFYKFLVFAFKCSFYSFGTTLEGRIIIQERRPALCLTVAWFFPWKICGQLTIVPLWFSVDTSFGHNSDFSSWPEANKKTYPEH